MEILMRILCIETNRTINNTQHRQCDRKKQKSAPVPRFTIKRICRKWRFKKKKFNPNGLNEKYRRRKWLEQKKNTYTFSKLITFNVIMWLIWLFRLKWTTKALRVLEGCTQMLPSRPMRIHFSVRVSFAFSIPFFLYLLLFGFYLMVLFSTIP